MEKQLDRRDFLRTGAATGVGVALAGIALSGCANQVAHSGQTAMLTYRTTPKDLIKVGFVGIGNMGSGHIQNLLKIEGCQITAVCDIRSKQTEWAKNEIVKAGFHEPSVYGKDDTDFVRMCQEEDLDLVYNAAPWRWHTPICMAAMKNNKNAASEVNIALTIEDCWKLIEASEKYHKHCVMMENCCYDYTEMLVLNMIQKGLFGELVHGECGYLHDLRALKLSPTFYQGMWRLHQSIQRNGNLYPTHGIGPMAWCMDIHRGDAFDTMTSFGSNSKGLNLFAEHMAENAETPDKRKHYKKWIGQQYALGDVNICLIKTKLGRTIICKHDTNLPRPYSRDFLVQGTRGIMRKYPTQIIHIEGRSKEHSWEEIDKYKEDFEHPVWKALKEKAQGAGHGGMDYIEVYRLIQAMRKGTTPDIDVYDSVAWSAIIPLSEQSIASHGQPVKFPDFTRGAWKQSRPLGVDTVF